jgi:IMP dehydrogenase
MGYMKILDKQFFTYDDLLIYPQFSRIASRSDIDTTVEFGETEKEPPIKLSKPVIAANMDTICEQDMAIAMWQAGGIGFLHRFAPIEKQIEWVNGATKRGCVAIPSVGVDPNKKLDALSIYDETGANIFCLDIAHANNTAVLDLLDFYHSRCPQIFFIVGNIASPSPELFKRLYPSKRRKYFSYPVNEGGNIIGLKVGIGPGSACETRVVAGVGVPQASAVANVATALKEKGERTFIIADGGIRQPADMAKAIGLGASAIMVGGLFAGTKETPPLGKKMFRGMASESAQLDHRGKVSNSIAEGATFDISENNVPAASIVESLTGGLRSAMSYSGCATIEEFQEKVIFIRVTDATVRENGAHFKFK